jgi:hypothetical protein
LVTTPESLIGEVDAAITREAEKITSRLSTLGESAGLSGKGLSADGFQVVDSNTNQVVEQGPWVPAFLPNTTPLPNAGHKFYVYGGTVYLEQTDTNGRLLALSITKVGGLGWIAGWSVTGFVWAFIVGRFLSRRFLRNYFALTGIRAPSIEEARRTGEGQNVEFKRGLSDDENRSGDVEEELLRSIAAFANTNDGVIIIGIDDNGHIKGLEVKGQAIDFKQRDRLEQKIHQLIRTRIRPTPPVRVAFEELRSLVIAKIEVGRGDSPAYMMKGAIYVRHGSSDVQAQTEDVVRLVSQHAL